MVSGTNLVTSHLKMKSHGHELSLPALIDDDAKLVIANANNFFSCVINDGFKKDPFLEQGKKTKDRKAVVWEQTKNGTLAELFGSLGGRSSQRIWDSQAQILSFCRLHREWLAPFPGSAFFLFKADKKLFVAKVSEESIVVRYYGITPDFTGPTFNKKDGSRILFNGDAYENSLTFSALYRNRLIVPI